MIFSRLRSAVYGLQLVTLAGVLFVAQPVFAQAPPTVDAGINAVNQEVGLSTADPRVIAARIINISLGFLAMIMVALILYAGFLWMTAGGNGEQIDKAKAYIRNAVIGLVIILSSWAIATFVISRLLAATGGTGGVGGAGPPPGGGGLGGGGGATTFQVRSITPSGATPIRNIDVRFLFSRDVQAASATIGSSIQVVRASDGTEVDGSMAIAGDLLTFTPNALCPLPNNTRHCFDANVEYIARATSALRSTSGQSLVCGGFAPPCEVHFTTGDAVDVTPPTADITVPFDGQNVSANDLIQVTTHATDDAGVSLIETSADGAQVGSDAPAALVQNFDATVFWNTTGLTTGAHTLQSVAHDIDTNQTPSRVVTVQVRPAFCFNGVQDGDETGLDCGGSCGACAGGACTTGGQCASGVCQGGQCVELPIITGIGPGNGRPGTLVTITGVNFGATPGRVTVGGVVAQAPAACTGAGVSTWNARQVVVAVPEGAPSGPIVLTNTGSDLSDATNDTQGPAIPDFAVDASAHPGLCAVRPDHGSSGDRVDLVGVGLGGSSDRVFWNDREIASFLSWGDTQVGMSVPVLTPARYAVRARSGGELSNTVAYTIVERASTGAPVLDDVSPADAPVASYVTLTGHGFGTGIGTVRFHNNTTGEEAIGDVSFPDACATSFWRDTSIVVKVPRTIGGLGGAVPDGAYQVRVVRADRAESNTKPFTVASGPARPGICTIQPTAGPADTGVQVIGEHFGAAPGNVSFAGTGATRVDAAVAAADWQDGQLATRVPRGAVTGLVTVTQGTRTSNGVPFQVRNCQEDASICGAAETCCASGVCSIGGSCPSVAQAAVYAWRTSTGLIPIHPQVVEECEATRPPSPSPWSGRTGGDQACTNAEVIVRFNTQLDATSVSPANFIVRQCTAGGADPCTSATVIASRLLEVLPADTGTDYIRFRPDVPGGQWSSDATYQVILTTGIRSASGLPMDARPACGAGNGYCFQFHTRTAGGVCRVGLVTVTPTEFTANDLDQSVPYRAMPRAEGDLCIALDGSTMDWTWDTAGDGRAAITNTRGPAGNVLDQQTATTLAETGDLPVPVDASAHQDGGDVAGTGRLFIRLVPPRVEASGPDCDAACVNAALWARFNVAMDPVASTNLSNIWLQRCTNEACRTFDPPGPLDLSSAPAPTLSTVPGQPAGSPLRFLVISPTHLVAGVQQSYLEPGRFYKVTLRGGASGFRSASALPLTELNDPEGFAWTFRVREGEDARCSIASVTVAPAQKYESIIGARQSFVALPVSAPDSCSASGQPLIADQSYAWTSSELGVARFLNASGEGVTDTAPPPSWCTAQCVLRGATGIAGRIATCGNSVVETTDARYCRHGAAACAPGEAGCTTIHGDACQVLNPGSQAGEECDLGAGNGPGSSCSTSCLWNAAPAITATPPGSCGNGTVDRGEQCDPGRSCLGGTNPGRTCTADAECGTGGTCGVGERFGCSTQCQALGAAAARSTCGNNDVSDGETCDDGNRTNGDGCNANCLHEGSGPVTALCGNGRVESGEACDRAAGGVWPAAGCDPITCLHTGTSACGAAGIASCCGNAVVDTGEDCDDGNSVTGDGCGSRCLAEGSSVRYAAPSFCGDGTTGTGEQCEAPTPGDGRTDPVQLATIVGLDDPGADGRMQSTLTANVESVSGNATYGLQCGFTDEASCSAPGTGLTDGGCCAARPTLTAHYPPSVAEPGGSDVCRNVQISGTFNQPMGTASFTGNFIVATEIAAGASCPDGTQPLGAVPYVAVHGWRAIVAQTYQRLLHFFRAAPVDAAPWCAGSVQGTVSVEPSGTGSRAVFQLEHALAPDTRYRVIFRGDPDLSDGQRQGIRSARGVVAPADPIDADAGALSWTFRTGSRICTADNLRVRDVTTAHPGLFTVQDESHPYVATVESSQAGRMVPLSSVAEYAWNWQPWTSSDNRILSVGGGVVAGASSTAPVQAHGTNGHALIFAGIKISADTVNVPSTVNRVVSGSALGVVNLCERPWPSLAAAPFRDVAGSPSLATTIFSAGPFYNFSTMYCMDKGKAGPDEDLPAMTVTAVPTPSVDAAQGILRQYLLTFSDASLARDGVGVRIAANPLHLSPSAWYASRGFTGTPQALTVDGYEAVRDGATVYVAAANAATAAGPIYSNIYIVSRNPDASADTGNIFDQLVANLAFNINFTAEAQNSCVDDGTGALHLVNDAVKSCTADWECIAAAPGTHCASLKTKLQRDTKRVADFQSMASNLEQSKSHEGTYPTIQSGSYLSTLTNSRWPSWSATFATAVGKEIPQDPVNRFLTCGRCHATNTPCVDAADCGAGDTCAAQDGYDPATCWKASDLTYQCPQLDAAAPASVSRIYQYRSVNGGNRYELSTELEGPGPAAYAPPLATEVNRCDNTDTLCLHDADCIVHSETGAVIGTGRCVATGGRWLYEGICRGRRYGNDAVCGNGIRGASEACELGETQPVSCVTASGQPGTKEQVCNDCSAWGDGPATACIANALCGNGRVDARQCLGGSGFKYGQACTTDANCTDPRDPAPGSPGYAPLHCQSVGAGAEETCDDGALNGTYGHCNRTCTGYDAFCGDGRRSAGETCDKGALNGAYCSGSAGCTLATSCNLSCTGVAPYCGDHIIQAPEQCDGGNETTAGAVCRGGDNANRPCSTATDCPNGTCGGSAASQSCAGVTAQRCSNDKNRTCTANADCDVHDAAGVLTSSGSCLTYNTQHVRLCERIGSPLVGGPQQCTWDPWSACEPVGFCGDGNVDQGEQCDDGNTSDNDACTTQCKNNICGDGFMLSGTEECDQGSRNGSACSAGADYASTCAACSATCRVTVQSGGYCGNNSIEGPEQCDGSALPTPLPTCRALGYDYSAKYRCFIERDQRTGGRGNATTAGFVVDSSEVSAKCFDDPANPNDIVELPITCSAACGLTGCKRCSDEGGNGSISAQVFDAFYGSMPVPGARVTLYNRGTRITEAFTDPDGRFTLTNINEHAECGYYRIIVDMPRDNPCTGPRSASSISCNGAVWPETYPNVDESVNGGYWSFESDNFALNAFASQGLHDSPPPLATGAPGTPRVFLIPRVSQGETMAVLTWTGALPSMRYLDAHLVTPESLYFHRNGESYERCTPGATADAGSTPTANMDGSWKESLLAFLAVHPAHAQFGGFGGCPFGICDNQCVRDISYHQPGDRDIDNFPNARLSCFHNDASFGVNGAEDCGSFVVAPESIRYKRGPQAVTGDYYYLVNDWHPQSPPSMEFYPTVQATVRIVTYDRLYTVHAPTLAEIAASPSDVDAACSAVGGYPTDGAQARGKYWVIFKQNAASGAITIFGSHGQGKYLCTGSNLYPGVAGPLPTPIIP